MVVMLVDRVGGLWQVGLLALQYGPAKNECCCGKN